jgi:hypothetical protein
VAATTQLKLAAARGILRSLFALSRYVRLFGLSHARTEAQLESTLARIRGLIPVSGVVIELAEERLTVESVLLDVTSAEQGFARFLRETHQTTFQFDEKFSSEMLEDVVSAMAFDRAPVTNVPPPVLLATPDDREWLSGPSRLLRLLNVAWEEAGGAKAAAIPHSQRRLEQLASEDTGHLLHVIGKLGHSSDESAALGAAREFQRIPSPLIDLLRELLTEFSDLQPAPSYDALLLRVADQIVIRVIVSKLQDTDIATAEVPGLLERLGRQLHTLRTVMPRYDEKKADGGAALEPRLEALEHELWSTAPDSVKRRVLLCDTPYYMPAASMVEYLERMIAHGEDGTAAEILRNYGSAVDGRDAEGRRRSARGIGELAELYALVAPDFVPRLVKSVSLQLMRESDVRMQALLSAALMRLSYEAQQQRDFVTTAAASDALEEILQRRPVLGMELRPRISVENRLPEYVDEALSAAPVSPELITLLQRHAVPVTQQLCSRFLQCSLREESAHLTSLAEKLGDESTQELLRRLRTGSSDDALAAVGLLSSLAPDEVVEVLPRRTSEWSRAQQDVLIRQLAIASSPKRGLVLLRLLPDLDGLIIPEAIDEIGISGEANAVSSLIDIAMTGEDARFSAYSKVKAIEALGRLRAASTVEGLHELLHGRKLLHWAQAHEVRIAALQALHMIDPERAASLVPQSGITVRELSLGPLAVDPGNPWARQRRYSRVFPIKPMMAVATSKAGKAGLDIVALSLGGGRARRQGKMQPGGDVNLQLQLALRKLNSQVLVREVAGNEITFEIADIGLSDRSRLRHLLLAQTPPSPRAAA